MVALSAWTVSIEARAAPTVGSKSPLSQQEASAVDILESVQPCTCSDHEHKNWGQLSQCACFRATIQCSAQRSSANV